MVFVEDPVGTWLRMNKDVSVGVVGAADACVLLADVVVVGRLDPGAAEKVLTELDADGFDFVAFFVCGVFVSDNNDLGDGVAVELCEVCHLFS